MNRHGRDHNPADVHPPEERGRARTPARQVSHHFRAAQLRNRWPVRQPRTGRS